MKRIDKLKTFNATAFSMMEILMSVMIGLLVE
jgi:hypothetical protein